MNDTPRDPVSHEPVSQSSTPEHSTSRDTAPVGSDQSSTQVIETVTPTVFYDAEQPASTEVTPLPDDPAIIRLESESPAPDPEEWAEAQEFEPPSQTPPQAVEAQTPPPKPVEVQPTTTETPREDVGVSNDLEEQIFAPSAPQQGPQVGQQVGDWTLQSDLGRGWFTATDTQGETQTVYVRPDATWAGLLPHRLLPQTEERGGMRVVEQVTGEALPATLPAPQALAAVGDLARLIFALEKQGYALTDFDPAALVQTADGLKLARPPRVVRLGETDPAALRDGLTAPEVLAGRPATADAGVYFLGAVLYSWLTGHAPALGGPSLAELGAFKEAGIPQLLSGMLAPAGARTTPTELLDTLKRLGRPALPTYRVAAKTSIGLNPDRPANEDSYGFTQEQFEFDGEQVLRLRGCVSDGMGGMAAGEVASEAAVRAFLTSTKPDLTGMVWDANAAVLEAMAGRDGGCTITGVELRGSELQLGHVGDSRAYLRAAGKVTQISRDHSLVAAMVANGQMTPEEAQVSPERNKVLRSLGSLRQPQQDYVQTAAHTMQVGDRVLLLSDGVWGEVSFPVLEQWLSEEDDLQELVDHLVQLALDAGAPDNATALVIERTA